VAPAVSTSAFAVEVGAEDLPRLISAACAAPDWTYLGGVIDRDLCNRYEHYFRSIHSPAIEEGDRDLVCDDPVRTANRWIVSQCVNRMQDGAVKKVSFSLQQLCDRNRDPPYNGASPAYMLRRNGHRLQLSMRIRMVFPEGDGTTWSHADEMMTDVRYCTEQLRALWMRYNIDFSVLLDSNKSPNPALDEQPRPLMRTLDFPYRSCRSNASLICYRGQGEADLIDTIADITPVPLPRIDGLAPDRLVARAEMCQTLTHELGHLMGLPDEYDDDACPDREFVSEEEDPTSIMNEDEDWDEWDFYPRHIRSILRPVCRR